MKKDKLILHRFCSTAEFELYLAGQPLYNPTDHYRGGHGGSTSTGFCFFSGNVSDWAQRLNGIVDFDVLLTVEVSPVCVRQSQGVYADWANDNGATTPPRKIFTEYCAKSYSRDTFRFINADRSYSSSGRYISRSKIFEQWDCDSQELNSPGSTGAAYASGNA